MHDFDQFERRLAAALRSDADQGTARFEPQRVARAAIAGTQRRAVRMPRRFSTLAMFTRLAAAAVIGVLVVGGAFFLGQRGQPAVVGGPSQTPGASASPSEPVSASAGPNASVVPVRAPSWQATGSMVAPVSGGTATLLAGGKVLVTGGDLISADGNASQLYDPASGTWTRTGSMAVRRGAFTSSLLSDGRVLVAGGQGSEAGGLVASAELYDPASGTWTRTGNMTTPRDYFSATLLPDDTVLVAGGSSASGDPLAAAEVYDPGSGTWTATEGMLTPRFGHTAKLLPDGKVLVVGGAGLATRGGVCCDPLPSAELYDPGTGTWTATRTMVKPRVDLTATLLPGGKVLVAGGDGTSAELYDPAIGTWSTTGPRVTTAGVYFSATLLPDGKVIVAGGWDLHVNTSGLASAELYDPGSGTWTATARMATPRMSHTATLLRDGRVLVAGGGGTSAEVYDPGTGQ